MKPDDCKLSVIIITHNSGSVIASCLDSVPPAAGGCTHEIIVVDNNSSDDSLSVATLHAPSARIIENDSNRGFAAACNRASETARGEFLLFLNPDVVADPGSIARMIDQHSSLKNPGVVAARMRFPDGKFQATCRKFPTIENLAFSRQSPLAKLFKREYAAYTYADSKSVLEVEAVAGTMLLIRAELFRKMGKFDERFFLYMEDTDLSLRLSLNKYSNYFLPDAGGQHAWGTGSTASQFKRYFHHHNSMWKYFLKHYPNGFSLILLPLLLMMNLILLSILSIFRR